MAFFQQHQSLWQRIQDATDGELSSGDYGYDVRVQHINDTKLIIHDILLEARWGSAPSVEEGLRGSPAYVAFSREAADIVSAAVRADNILLCTSDHVLDVRDHQFRLTDCELSTQSLMYFLRFKCGWQLTGMDFAEDCCDFEQDSFFCLVRDQEDPALKTLNEKLEELNEMPVGPPLPQIYTDWGVGNPTKRMERVLKMANDLLKKYDEVEALKREILDAAA